MYAIATTMLNMHLRNVWEIIDAGEPKEKVINWLRMGGHRSIDDEAGRIVADLVEKDQRAVE